MLRAHTLYMRKEEALRWFYLGASKGFDVFPQLFRLKRSHSYVVSVENHSATILSFLDTKEQATGRSGERWEQRTLVLEIFWPEL